jgi:hypothetical protein
LTYRTRLRVILTDTAKYGRDSAPVREKFDDIMRGLGGEYAGYAISGGALRHAYLVNDPTEDQSADLLLLSRSIGLRINREEYGGTHHVPYDLNAIMADIARVLAPQMIDVVDEPSSVETARGWSGVTVLRKMVENGQLTR